MREYRILHLEDSIQDSELVKRQLQKGNLKYEYLLAIDRERYVNGIRDFKPDVILCDHALPQFDSYGAFDIYNDLQLDIPFILVTGSVSEEYAVEMIKKGIDDYLLKTNLHRLPMAIEGAVYKRDNEKKVNEGIKKLTQNELRMKEAQKIAHLGTWEVVFATGIAVWSEETCAIYGLEIEDCIQSYAIWLSYVHPDDVDSVKKAIHESEKNLSDSRLYHRIILNDGTVKHLYSESKYKFEDGKLVGIYGISQDITEKKQLENQLLRGQRMESIGTLAGGIAHDINNILSPILLCANFLSMKIKDETSLKMLHTIEMSAKRGADLIKQVLAFARGVDVEFTNLQVRQIIEEMSILITETFPKSITLRLTFDENLPSISADATQLHQVLMNLCVNARDAMPNGGTIAIIAETIAMDEQSVKMHIEAKIGTYVVITVTDNGMGIPPSVIERIYEPFFTTKEIGKGTGLGLSTVATIIKSHAGFITVTSDAGKGTTFKLFLPAQIEIVSPVITDDNPLQAGNGELILVVDDEARILEITKAILESYGYSVLTASDGAEAIAIYSEHNNQISLVITDMMMPTLDGIAAIEEIQNIDPDAKLIVVSGLKQNSLLIKANTVEFLKKPYTSEKLIRLIDTMLHTLEVV